ncbi:hypothetical protein ASA1KI_40490 [Opitutales bacterium ASA1]|nr:hypothetical protein ASA1KI_40490 [Opitutales bacterium ASA1]
MVGAADMVGNGYEPELKLGPKETAGGRSKGIPAAGTPRVVFSVKRTRRQRYGVGANDSSKRNVYSPLAIFEARRRSTCSADNGTLLTVAGRLNMSANVK